MAPKIELVFFVGGCVKYSIDNRIRSNRVVKKNKRVKLGRMAVNAGKKSSFDEVRIWMSPVDACTFLSSEEAERDIRSLVTKDGAPPGFVERLQELFELLVRMCNSGTSREKVNNHRLVTVPRAFYSSLKTLGLCTFRDATGKTHTLRDKKGIPVCVNSEELQRGKGTLKAARDPTISPDYLKYVLHDELKAYHRECEEEAKKYGKDRDVHRRQCQDKILQTLQKKFNQDTIDIFTNPKDYFPKHIV